MVMESAERGPTTAQHPGCSTAKKAKALYFIYPPRQNEFSFFARRLRMGWIHIRLRVRSFSLTLLFSQHTANSVCASRPCSSPGLKDERRVWRADRACSESDRHHTNSLGGQARHLRPAVRGRVVDLRRAETLTGVPPTEDVELATHRCGGVSSPSGAHACQLRPCIGLRIVHVS